MTSVVSPEEACLSFMRDNRGLIADVFSTGEIDTGAIFVPVSCASDSFESSETHRVPVFSGALGGNVERFFRESRLSAIRWIEDICYILESSIVYISFPVKKPRLFMHYKKRNHRTSRFCS